RRGTSPCPGSTERRLRGVAVALGVDRLPELEQTLALQRPELLARLALVDRELVLDHLPGERLVPREAAHPVLAGSHDVGAFLPAGDWRRGGAARELLGQPDRLGPELRRRPLFERLGHCGNGTGRTGRSEKRCQAPAAREPGTRSRGPLSRPGAASRRSARRRCRPPARSAPERARPERRSRRPRETGDSSIPPTRPVSRRSSWSAA